MKLFAPDYYKDFHCIAENCKHSCCIGWEIEIDGDTSEFYSGIPGEFGNRLRKNIDFESSSFKLCENEHCPFLNKSGLCDIIINLGEGALCQICEDHPRFRNFFSDRTEIGLGLCCEEAARLILDKKAKTELLLLEDADSFEHLSEGEKELLSLREKAFCIIQDRTTDFKRRVSKLLDLAGSAFPQKNEKEWSEIFLSLERLDESWSDVLCNAGPRDFEEKQDEIAEEQLLFYFIYRHLPTAIDDGRIKERMVFCVLSLYMVRMVAKQLGIYEGARLYSSEIEYSDENIDILLNILSTEGEKKND